MARKFMDVYQWYLENGKNVDATVEKYGIKASTVKLYIHQASGSVQSRLEREITEEYKKSDAFSRLIPEQGSLRDYFAGQSLIGMIERQTDNATYDSFPNVVAFECYRLADAMIAEREKDGTK